MTIELVYQPTLARSDLEPLKDAFRDYDAEVSITEGRQPGPQAALEWALPVAIAIICSAPVTKLVEGFFGEAGKDAYEKLKAAFRWAFKRSKETGMNWHSVGGEVKSPPPVGMQFNIGRGGVRFIFPDSLTPEDAALALEQLNETLSFLAKMTMWQIRQSTLIDQNIIELYGEGFPADDAAMHRQQLLSDIVFGTWVFSTMSKAWIKAA